MEGKFVAPVDLEELDSSYIVERENEFIVLLGKKEFYDLFFGNMFFFLSVKYRKHKFDDLILSINLFKFY